MSLQRKPKSLLRSFIASFIYPAIIMTVIFTAVIILSILYMNTQNKGLMIALIVVAGVSLVLMLVAGYLFIRNMYKSYYVEMYKKTKNNLQNMCSNTNEIKEYDIRHVEEFDSLNEEVDKLKVLMKNSTLSTTNSDLSKIDFEYIPGFDRVIKLSSFKKHLSDIIYFSRSFRNALVEIHYSPEQVALKDDEISSIVFLLKQAFENYKNSLIILDDERRSVLIYLPLIDTFSRIQEQLTNILQNVSIAREINDSMATIPARAAIVAYPYSDIDEMTQDLQYAEQLEEEISIYLPHRIVGLNENAVMNDSMNINIVSKIIESIGILKSTNEDEFDYEKTINDGINALAQYISADEAGIISFNENNNEHFSQYNYSNSNNSLLAKDKIIDSSFVEAMCDVVDFDNSYYFSTRTHANNSLGRYLDKYRIASGFFYSLTSKNGYKGILYFFNRDRDMFINSYIREGLVLFSTRVSEFRLNCQREEAVQRAFFDIDCMMKYSDCFTYRIDRQTYEIINYSEGCEFLFPNIEVGKQCYRALYGLDRPCPNCPLLTSRKMIAKYFGTNLETSLNLVTDNNARQVRLLVKDLQDTEATGDRFNRELLINSFPTLVEEVKNCYAAKIKGYLLLLRIDNLDELIMEYGSEQALVAVRNLCKNIKQKNKNVNNIFYFNSQTICLLYQELGQIDIVNKCEAVYDLSKQKYFDDEKGFDFKITYLPMVFPSSYPTAYDFLKNAQKYYDNGSYEPNKDFIFFEENNYSRSASRKEFMLTVIDDKFGNETFTALLQPYVLAEDRRVYGVEMLLRLTDDYRNIVFNADELIKVAVANGKIKLISDALINYAGNLYRKQGSSIFKVFGLKRFSINIDYSYFTSDESINNLVNLIHAYDFPKDFIAFEIAEWDIKDHFGEYKVICETLKKHNITLLCDQYSGRHMSLSKLKEIGFEEIKIGRGIVGFIDSDPQKKAALTNIMTEAKELGFVTSVVGIENNTQYEIVKKLDINAMLQGYYFYKPLDKNNLVNALRNANAKFH